MAISENIKRSLYMESAGYCQNPLCNSSIVIFFESGQISNIIELAHIIGQSLGGPRGDSDLALSDRDLADNILVLCPTCHTLIDKNKSEYPVELLHEWKRKHQQKVKNVFSIRKFNTKQDLKSVVRPLFIENRAIYNKYGPFSDNSNINGMEAVDLWNKKVFDKIIPNNKKIMLFIKENEDLFDDESLEIIYLLYNHCEEFEYNKVSANKNPLATTFPLEIDKIWREQ